MIKSSTLKHDCVLRRRVCKVVAFHYSGCLGLKFIQRRRLNGL